MRFLFAFDYFDCKTWHYNVEIWAFRMQYPKDGYDYRQELPNENTAFIRAAAKATRIEKKSYI